MSLVGFKAQNHPQQKAKPAIDDRATTPEFFAELHDRFGFTVDVAAEAHNAKLPRFHTPEQNGLTQSWNGERVFCNPPYSNIRPWIEKAWLEREKPHRWIDCPVGSELRNPTAFRFCQRCDLEEWADGRVIYGAFAKPGRCGEPTVVMLLPANRTEQAWWQELVEPHLRIRRNNFQVEFLPGRMRFIRTGQTEVGPNERPPFGCCLLIWGGAS